MYPYSHHDRFTCTALALTEARQIEQSHLFMTKRDALLDVCDRLRKMLGVDRVRLYEYVSCSDSGPFFRGLVELGGMYANIAKLELPLAADWYSKHTAEHRCAGEPLLYPPADVQPVPPRYLPHAFWRTQIPKTWADILLADRSGIVGKLSIDNYFHPGCPIPDKAGKCQHEIERLLDAMRQRPGTAEAAEAVEAHRRLLLLNDLTEVLQAMVNEFDFDRARAYEYNADTCQFEARAEVGGTADPHFTSLKRFFHISSTRDDTVSFLTYRLGKPRVYRRGEVVDFRGDRETEPIAITFKCDETVGSGGVNCLMDIPLLASRNTIVGKITVDNKLKDPTGVQRTLDEALERKAEQIAYFAEMAAGAIVRANATAKSMGWWTRFILKHHGLSERTWTLIVAIVVAVVTGVASGIVRSLFDR